MHSFFLISMRVVWISLIVVALASIVEAQNELENMYVVSAELSAKSAVYDTNRDLLYATIGSEAGDNGNSLAIIDPESLEVIEYIYIGSEPRRLAMLPGSDLVYVGIDGEFGFRWFNAADRSLGPLIPLLSWSGSPGLATSFAIDPVDPTVVVVCCDVVGSSPLTVVRVFKSGEELSDLTLQFGPRSICFLNSSVLMGFSVGSGDRLQRMFFDGKRLQIDSFQTLQGLGFEIEASGDGLYFSNGEVVDPLTLNLLGKFPLPRGSQSSVEASRFNGLVYFMVDSYLKVFDRESFLEKDSAFLSGNFVTSSRGVLAAAGQNRLVFVDDRGQLGVISGVPFNPAPSSRLTVAGTDEDDEFIFDPDSRVLTINGNTVVIDPQVTLLTLDGLEGSDSISILGMTDVSSFAVLSELHAAVQNRFGVTHAVNFENVHFDGVHPLDEVVINDTEGNDQVLAFPGECLLIGDHVWLRATAPSIFVNGFEGSNKASFFGQSETVRLAINLNSNQVRASGDSFYLQINGFRESISFGGLSPFDTAVMVDSKLNDVAAMRPKYARFFNANADHRVREVESVTLTTPNGGRDRVDMFRPPGSNLFQNQNITTISSAGFRNSARNFEVVRIVEQ